MDMTLYPAGVCGQIDIPGSKSQTIRALLIALFAKGVSKLHNPLLSKDTESCLQLCKQLGAKITWEEENGEKILVLDSTSLIKDGALSLDCNNSGTTLYLASAMSCALGIRLEFRGDDQLSKRPIEPLLKSLKELGATIYPENATTTPFTLQGPLKGGLTSIKCMTSQYLSALLLGCPLASENTTIQVPILNEKPYVNMTESWLNKQKIDFQRDDKMSIFRIRGGQHYTPFEDKINGDFSSASFFFCAAAITGGTVTVRGLDPNDPQGDKGILKILSKMGCFVNWEGNSVTVTGPNRLYAGDFDLNDMPDALPALAITGCFASGPVKLYNTPQARLKETDRIKVLVHNINALGGQAQELEDGLIAYPVDRFTGTSIDGFGDHRIVMAMALASLKCTKELTILGSSAASITFPNFFELFARVSVH